MSKAYSNDDCRRMFTELEAVKGKLDSIDWFPSSCSLSLSFRCSSILQHLCRSCSRDHKYLEGVFPQLYEFLFLLSMKCVLLVKDSNKRLCLLYFIHELLCQQRMTGKKDVCCWIHLHRLVHHLLWYHYTELYFLDGGVWTFPSIQNDASRVNPHLDSKIVHIINKWVLYKMLDSDLLMQVIQQLPENVRYWLDTLRRSLENPKESSITIIISIWWSELTRPLQSPIMRWILIIMGWVNLMNFLISL